MRMQASLEFLLILSGVSAMALFTIAYYSHSVAAENLSVGLPQTKSYNSAVAYAGNVSIYAFILPNVTYGKEYQISIVGYGCNNGTAIVEASSNSSAFSANTAKLYINGVGAGAIWYEPVSYGYNRIMLSYSWKCGNYTGTGQENLLSFVTGKDTVPGNDTTGYEPNAYISNRTEMISYALIGAGKVNELDMFSHCTYASIFGPTPVSFQCGTTDTWEYSIFSGACYMTGYYTRTYCVNPQATNYTIFTVDASRYNFTYKFNLSVSYMGIEAHALISSNTLYAPLVSNKKIVGKASVENVSGIGPLENQFFLAGSNKSGLINDSIYSNYSQAKNNLNSMLSYYNGSVVDSSVFSSIQESISAFEKALGTLLSAPVSNSSCLIYSQNLLCKPLYPLSYDINVEFYNISANTTAYYMGSIIHIT
ncbi:MAG: hypothetical protein ACP5TK_00915 [Candidatus Micrarchaeia archaeon]